GAMRTASVLEYLARTHSVDVIVFREPDAPNPLDSFPPALVRNITVVDLPFHSRGALPRVLRNAQRFARGAPPLVDRFSGFGEHIDRSIGGRFYEVSFIEHFWCAEYVHVARRHSNRVVLDLHNVES